jgi:hypothetical protein
VEDHPAPIGVEMPAIGVAKRLVSAGLGTNPGAFDVIFEIRVENLGNVPLSNVQVTENLAATFPAPASFMVVSLQSAEFTVNPAFNGAGDTNLLAAGNTLAVGAGGTITLRLSVNNGGNTGPYTNQVLASGTSPGSQTVTDLSQDGDDPDPDDDGGAGDNNDPTVFVLAIPIPTLDEWGLLALAALLAGFAFRTLRRRQA